MKIKHLLAVFTVILSVNSAVSQDKKFKVHTVAFYNFENLFDTINDPDTYDEGIVVRVDDDYTPHFYKHKCPEFLLHEGHLVDKGVVDIEDQQSENENN